MINSLDPRNVLVLIPEVDVLGTDLWTGWNKAQSNSMYILRSNDNIVNFFFCFERGRGCYEVVKNSLKWFGSPGNFTKSCGRINLIRDPILLNIIETVFTKRLKDLPYF